MGNLSTNLRRIFENLLFIKQFYEVGNLSYFIIKVKYRKVPIFSLFYKFDLQYVSP